MIRRGSAYKGFLFRMFYNGYNENQLFGGIMRKKYGCLQFLFDITMCVVTGGLWLIWIFVREMRGRK